MIQLALFCALVTPALSQCSYTTSTTIPPNPTFNTSDGSIVFPSYCKKVKTISRPVSLIYRQQPVLIRLTANAAIFSRIDSICLTFFPVPNEPETFKAYRSTVYVDNSSLVETYITRSFASGVNIWSNAERTYANFNLGPIGCGVYLRYSCTIFGGPVKTQMVAFGPGSGNGIGQKLTNECLLNAQKLARDNGLDFLDSPSGYYLPSYNLPTRCVYKQICLPKNTSLSCQQGNSCKEQ